MGNRIRIVWLLSLVSALVVVGVQGYWLYNQYTYVVEAYSQEFAEKILKAGEDEYAIRQATVKPSYKYIIRKQVAYSGNDSLQDVSSQQFQFRINRPDTADSISLYFHWNPNISEEELQNGVNRMIADRTYPFRQELLDSLLAARLPGLRHTVAPWHEADSVHYVSHWERTGNLFNPQIKAYYAYNPLEKQGVVMHASISVQPVFRRMAMQWVISLGLILLLAACFIFQIKTILEQEKVNGMREHFVNTTIHELRRPVQTLKAFVAFLGDREMRSDERATEQVVQDAMFELDNLSAYLDKLKDMLRADSEATALNRMCFDLPALVEKVVRLTHVPGWKSVRLNTACDMGGSPLAEADPVHIANVLNNLIENAVKYSGREVDIEVKAERKGKGIVLTVADNGIGIPPAEQPKVFDKFYRGAGPPGQDVPGLGLGLSYVKLIAKAHQGDITLNSRPGKGTSISLFIPQ
jgi:two-component system phosphate regulon sensor histidine kinase PhoR